MKSLLVTFCLLLSASAAFGQAGSATITGAIADPAGAVISGANIGARNLQTGVNYPVVSTTTGNYTISQLPVGQYEVSATVPGFKRFVRSGITLDAAQVVRIDIGLEVGQATESVTVQADASLLKTETADVVHNITLEQLDNLPILGIGNSNAGSSGVRNPYSSVQFVPGVAYVANSSMVINGAPTNTAAYRVEGMDNTNHTVAFALQENQPSADAIQEVAVQTSDYAPEFGTAGGGLFNITMKSGTNQYHGSGYDYFVNEDLNAAQPFSNNPAGTGNIRPRNRRNDFGGTLGGPIVIPKVYNGHDKTFFFWSYEQFKESSLIPFNLTLPTAAYRGGDFSGISVNGGASPAALQALGVPTTPLASTDSLGRPIYANTIYDPATVRAGNGGIPVTDPFPNNMISPARFDPMAKAVQALIPNPTSTALNLNGLGSNLSQRDTTIPSLKLDQVTGTKGQLSFYWSTTQTDSQFSTPNGNADGLPDEISQNRGTFIHAQTLRLNYNYTLSPTVLLHVGAGYSRISFIDDAAFKTFNCAAAIGLQGCQNNFNFPTFTQMTGGPLTLLPGGGSVGSLGGMQQMGNAQAHTHTRTERPAYNANATWVKGNHSYKLGGEVWFQGNITAPPSGVLFSATTFAPITNVITNAGATALPFTPPLGLSGQQVGFPYANFLLGDYTRISQSAPTDTRMGKAQWALYLQDSWKVSRKLTLDYGLRWDYATLPVEQYGRSADFSATTANPSVGGRLGAPVFQATCNCSFAGNYPYAIGPRVGAAYQINPKTVLRVGWGYVYGFANDIGVSSSAIVNNDAAGPNAFSNIQTSGLPQPVWPNFAAGQTPLPGAISSSFTLNAIDRNATRPPRQNQWSIGLQREITSNFSLEAAYVGNRGVWWSGLGQGANLGFVNQVSPAVFSQYGLDPFHNPSDALLLSQPISSAQVVARIPNLPLPYVGYPTNSSLLNALRPYPQFSTLTVTNAPTGKTYYDSLQVKVTKRMSHGLSVNSTFTWSKSLINTRENFFDASSSSKTFQTTDQPFLLNANILYTTQKAAFLDNVKFANTIVKDWQLGAFLQYGSGFPLTPPTATTANPLTSDVGVTNYMIRNPNVSLYNKDLNCHCINPYTDQMLNPAAWSNPVAGTYGPNALYGDFRGPRHPNESFNIGRNFRIRERMNLQIRAEFVNIFNRTYLGNPSTVNPLAAPSHNPAGQITGGFGTVNATAIAGAYPSIGGLPRTGTLVARFTF
ncbi:MAG: TonB-dependent receptor [Acidobacteriia bacterium]|nr:TonB-dependent receptor [Terriglobia bacterium]